MVDPTGRGPRRPALLAVAIAAGFFAAVAPTLRWQEFSGGSENLVVETVLEMRRGGPWLIPTLLDVPRVNKPPLTVWLTAAAVRDDTVARLASRHPAERGAAFRDLAWDVRWPSLLASCAMLLATYGLARNLLLGPRVALASIAVCGSTLLFLRFARAATTDVQLALWVTVAGAFLALAIFRGRWWAGCLGAGAALGLAFMSKGPVAFVQTILPFALFLAWRRVIDPASVRDSGTGFQPVRRAFDSTTPSVAASSTRVENPCHGQDSLTNRRRFNIALPVVAGVVLMLLIGLPWYGWVIRHHPDTLKSWWVEVTRVNATQLPPDPWYTYFVFPVWLVPWLPWFIAGAWVGGLQAARHPSVDQTATDRAWRDGTVAALLLTLVPIVVMSLFRDKNERYLLPMLPPAAILAARAAVGWWQTRPDATARDPAGKLVEAIHWGTLFVLALGLPIAGPLLPKLGLGAAWFNGAVAIATAAGAIPIVVIGYILRRRTTGGRAVFAAVAATASLLLVLQFPAMHGYGRIATSDLKPLADAVLAEFPDAQVYQFEPAGRTRVRMDLPIYLGRATRAIGPAEMPRSPGQRPQVVVFLDRHADRQPSLDPPWKEFATGAGRKGGWRAYVLPAAGRD